MSKPIIVITHERSGTHLLINCINCADNGLFYTIGYTPNEDDFNLEFDGVTLLIDSMSSQYLHGAEVDYTESLQGSQFSIKNPNAQTTCGCGSSFNPG